MGRAWAGLLIAMLVGAGCRPPPPTTENDSGPTSLVLIHTADLHSHLFPERQQIRAADAARGLGATGAVSEVGGFARIAAIVRDVRAGSEHSLYLDSGDLVEGTAAYNEFHGEPELRALSRLGLAATVLGNHDLDPSADELAERQARFGHFPVLSSNVVARDGALSELLSASTVVQAGELRVGVIGAANPRSPTGVERADNPWGLEVLPTASAVQAAIDELAPRVDVIVALSHLGLDGDESLIRATTGLDVVLGGHQHIVTDEPLVREDRAGRRVWLVHSGALGRYVGELDLELSARDGAQGREVEGARFTLLPVADSQPADESITALLAPFQERLVAAGFGQAIAYADGKIERNAANGGDSALGDLVADAFLRSSGAQLALLNATGLRADLPPGELMRESFVAALPFDDPLTVLSVSGAELRLLLNQQARVASERECRTPVHIAGFSLAFKCSGTSSSARVLVNGAELDPRAAYQLVTTRYLADGGSGFELLATLPRRDLALQQSDALQAASISLPGCSASALPCLQASALRDGRVVVTRD